MSASYSTKTTPKSLLTLPGELRNMIWEYALSEPNGLFYRCIPDDKIFSLHATYDPHYTIDFMGPIHSSGDTSTCVHQVIQYENDRQVWSGDSHVVNAWNADELDGWTVNVQDLHAFTATRYRSTEHNQLKYVCRTLYRETRRLGLRFNDVTFIRKTKWQSKATTQFQAFLNTCSSTTKSWIRKVHLRTSCWLNEDSLVPFWWRRGCATVCSPTIQFCEQYSQARVYIWLNRLNLNQLPVNAIIDARYILRCVRNKSIKDEGTGPFSPTSVRDIPNNLRFPMAPGEIPNRLENMKYTDITWIKDMNEKGDWKDEIGKWQEYGL